MILGTEISRKWDLYSLCIELLVCHYIDHNIFEPEKFGQEFKLIWATENLVTNSLKMPKFLFQ